MLFLISVEHAPEQLLFVETNRKVVRISLIVYFVPFRVDTSVSRADRRFFSEKHERENMFTKQHYYLNQSLNDFFFFFKELALKNLWDFISEILRNLFLESQIGYCSKI